LIDKSILIKSAICGLVYLVFHLLIIPAQYVFDFSLYSALVLGILCGITIAAISYSNTAKKTVVTMVVGLVSSVLAQLILWFTGLPYAILWNIFKNDVAIQEIGHLTVNELIGYNWGFILFFLPSFLITFAVLIISVPVFISIRNRSK